MKFFNFKLILFLSFLFIIGYYYSQPAAVKPAQQEVSSWKHAVDYAKENLPLKGRFTINSDGYSYIKVDNDYIHKLFPMLGLKQRGFRKPPFFRSKESPGAHITVFYAGERVYPKEEIGKTFHFQLKDISIVSPSKNDTYAILEVEAPELEQIRKKYGLSPKVHGHEFHITLAKKRAPKPNR